MDLGITKEEAELYLQNNSLKEDSPLLVLAFGQLGASGGGHFLAALKSALHSFERLQKIDNLKHVTTEVRFLPLSFPTCVLFICTILCFTIADCFYKAFFTTEKSS